MSLDKTIFLAYLLLLVWIPLPLGSNRPWAVAIMEIWVFVLSALWLFLFIRKKVVLPDTFKKAWLAILMLLLFLLWSVLQIIPLPVEVIEFFSPTTAHLYADAFRLSGESTTAMTLSLNTYNTSAKILESLSYGLLFCLTLLLVTTKKRLLLLLWTIVLLGLFQALFGSLMTLSGYEYGFFVKKEAYLGVATGTFVNRNHFANYLVMAAAIGIGLLLSQLKPVQFDSVKDFIRYILEILLSNKIVIRLSLVLMIIALVLTHSRMGNMAFFISLTLVSLLYLLSVKNPPRQAVILFVSLFIIDVIVVGSWFGIDKVAERLDSTHLKTSGRNDTYRDTLNIISDYPLIGTGGGNYAITFLRYRGKDIHGFYDHAHNDYLQISSEYGLLGTGILGLLVILCLINGVIALRQRHSRLFQGLRFSCVMGILAVLIHSSVEFNLQIPANISLYIIILSLSYIARYKKYPKTPRQ